MADIQLTFKELSSFVFTISALLGACFGSFLSVCIWRIPRDESIVAPRSHCPSCNKLIPWYFNVPIMSWLMLGGKCAYCKTKISPRYILLELLTMILFVMVAWKYFYDPYTIIYYWIIVFGLELGTFIDLDWYILPNRVTIGGIILGLAASILFPFMAGDELSFVFDSLIESIIGFAVGFGSLYLVSVIGKAIYKKDAMGFGDVKLMGAVGAIFGWESVIFTIFVSSFLGSVIGLSLIAMKKRELQGRIPYGPFIAAATLLWMFFGSDLIYWYFGLLRAQ